MSCIHQPAQPPHTFFSIVSLPLHVGPTHIDVKFMMLNWFSPGDYTCVCSEKLIQEIKIQDTAACATKVSFN